MSQFIVRGAQQRTAHHTRAADILRDSPDHLVGDSYAERAAEHLSRLQDFTSSLSEAAGAAEIGRIVVSVLGEEFGADTVRIAYPMVETKELCVLHHSAPGTELPVSRTETLSPDSPTPVVIAFRTGEELRLAIPSEIADGRPIVKGEPSGSAVVAVPLVAGRTVLGAVELVHRRNCHLGPADRALFDDYLNQTALALDRARSYEEARRATTRLQLLADAAVRVASAGLDLGAISEAVVQEITRTDFAQLAAVHLVQNDGREPSLAAMADVTLPSQGQGGRELVQGLRSEILAEVARTGRTHLVSLKPEHSSSDAEAIVGMLAVPLRAAGEVTGTLTAVRRRPASSFSPDDERILQDLAARAALSIENALLYQRAQTERKRAESASRAKDEFLAMLGHELRNPLSPILTAVHLMRLRGGDSLAKERTIIERQVNHMVRLVDDLLDVSRIARRKIQLKVAPVDLGDVVASAVETASPALEERSHRLVTTIPTEGLVVDADRNRLAQAIVNLLTNAARYTPPNGTIEITVEEHGGVAILHVTDNGVGIEPGLLPRIFQLFVQGDQTSDRPRGGLGLGLAIAESLVEMHGGRLSATSDGPGRGSTFTIELPLLPDRRVRSTLPSDPPAMPTLGPAKRILVVEDNADAAEALGEFLVDLGHVVRIARDGPEALRIVTEVRPDIALLDIGLPGMDGYELAERLVKLLGEGRPRLVALTGYGQRADRERSRAAGFDEHLVKPVGIERLQGVIAGEANIDPRPPPLD